MPAEAELKARLEQLAHTARPTLRHQAEDKFLRGLLAKVKGQDKSLRFDQSWMDKRGGAG